MSSTNDERLEWELPHLRETFELVVRFPWEQPTGIDDESDKYCSHKVKTKTRIAAVGQYPTPKEENNMADLEVNAHVYDVKFWPYSKIGSDPIFAVIETNHTLICRASAKKDKATEVILCIKDEDDARNSSVAWSKDSRTGAPLICVAGGCAKIKIFEALTGKLRTTFTGHGGEINDLVISPINPQVLVSASEDTEIRLWSLDPAHKEHPCVAICAGEGHREALLSIAFHETGQYILSGGQDHLINLWVMPDLPSSNTCPKKPTNVHFPHFSTSQIHSNYVDCVAFHHDLILSKAEREGCIVLWLITGFSSSSLPPPPSAAPTTYDNQTETRSAFSPPSSQPGESPQYMRLLQFDVPGCEQFYMRFSLFSPLYTAIQHPVLAICNSRSRVFFWDLRRLEEYFTFTEAEKNGDPMSSPKRPQWLNPGRSRKKDQLGRLRPEGSPVESSVTSSSTHTASSDAASAAAASFEAETAASRKGWEKKYFMGDPQQGLGSKREEIRGLESHKTETILRYSITGRQVAWSPGGEWCVVVGSPNVVSVFQRWADGRGLGCG